MNGGRAWIWADDKLWRVIRRGADGGWTSLTATSVDSVEGTWEFDLAGGVITLAEPALTAFGLPAQIDLSRRSPAEFHPIACVR